MQASVVFGSGRVRNSGNKKEISRKCDSSKMKSPEGCMMAGYQEKMLRAERKEKHI
jgi:hypothetical protein